MTVAESGFQTHSYCKNCGKKIVGYTATLRTLDTNTSRTISIWFDNTETDTCPTGTPHTPSQHPTLQ